MKVLDYGKFVDAMHINLGQEKEIQALYKFLSAAIIKDKHELQLLFPKAEQLENDCWKIIFSHGRLNFFARFDYEVQFILALDILPVSTEEEEKSE